MNLNQDKSRDPPRCDAVNHDQEAQRLLRCIDRGTLPTCFDHRTHVLLAWHLVRRHPLGEAMCRMRSALRRLSLLAGQPDKYDETLTRAWMVTIADRTVDAADRPFERFVADNGDLMTREARLR